jgi:DNA-binding NtrC family response regulator
VGKVLIADDDVELRSILADLMREEGLDVAEAADGVEAVAAFRRHAPDVALLDLRMPRRDGLQALGEIRGIDDAVPVILLTGHGDIATAVAAMKQGAFDFFTKPPDYEKLVFAVRQAVAKRSLEQEVRRVSAALHSSLETTFGTSEAIRTVITTITHVARTDLAVVIQGETGTGKSYLANAIHALSPRAGRPFVRVDLSVIPESIVESELFGARRGAYTGADRDKAGYFAGADGGTILLDDIENAAPHVQAKLLEVIERKRICPVGASEPVDLDFRVIVATNRDIKACVARRDFREDLFYRLGEFMIVLPPLRERPEDILFFLGKFLADSCAELGKSVRGVDEGAREVLLRHPWPGNIRELKHVVRRAVLLARGELIGRESIDLLIQAEGPAAGERASLSLKKAVHDLERELIAQALERTGNNKAQAARLLEISYPTLLAKIREHGC